MTFSTLVYRCPGAHFAYAGQTYEYKGVYSEIELAVALKNGWFASLVEAVEFANRADDAGPDELEEKADDAPPTREELELKATELGIKFDGRTSDAKLLERINEALEG